MGRGFLAVLVGLLVLSALFTVVASRSAADGGVVPGTEFPNRLFEVTRSPPGGPKSDTVKVEIAPEMSGMWSARLDTLAGAAIIVQVYRVDGSILVLEGSSKLRSVGQESTPVPLLGGGMYQAWFTPFGKSGTSILAEKFVETRDTTPPTLLVPADIVAEATGPSGAVVTYTVSATDDVDPSPVVSCSPASGSTFPLGTTTVMCTATDFSGNTATASFSVTVRDTTPPTLVVPENIVIEAEEPTPVTYTVSASDLVDPSPVVACSPPSGSVFPLGTTTVTCTATDFSGKTATASFTVTLFTRDTTPPTLVVPADITAEATGPSGAVVTYTVSATDDVDPSPVVSCSPASGSTFPLGTTTVMCTATDFSGNTATASFSVTVRDTTPPTLTVPADITAEATGPSGAVVTYEATATDLVDPSPVVVCSPASGSTFPLGMTTVMCTATDTSGNTAARSFAVTVRDTTAPELVVPADITAEATGPSGAVVTYTVSVSDAVDPAPVIACSPPSGSTFPLGTTTVMCTATDAAGNTAMASFNVRVRDTTPPTLTVPADITAEATGPSGAVVTYEATATDLVDPSPVVVCSPASGSTFPLGMTTVMCTATDASGNTATDSFTVTVRDTTPPAINVPADITAEATGPSGAVVTYTVSASDVVDTSPVVSCSPPSGSTFPLGTTNVMCTATDDSGNTATASFSVTVRDTTPPTLTVPADIVVESAEPTAVTYTVSALDLVDPSPVVVCSPASGSTFPLGMTTVMCTATDASGNTATASFSVTVQPPLAVGISWRYYDFFAVPYGEWWDWRTFFADDKPIGAECFSEAGFLGPDGIPFTFDEPCFAIGDPTIPDWESFPYTNWRPTPVGDVAIYAPYRFEANVPSHAGYTIDRPVVLPTCEGLKASLAGSRDVTPPIPIDYTCPTPQAGGSVAIDWYMQYLDTAGARALRDTRLCPDVTSSVGFAMELRLTLVMDSVAAAKLFGVTDPAMWVPGGPSAPMRSGCGTGLPLDVTAGSGKSGTIERGLKVWLEDQGNGPYDVFSATGAAARNLAVDGAGSYNAVTDKHTLTIMLMGEGLEALMARWMYWGATTYADGINLGAAPAGWWGMEAPWLEDFRMIATIDTDFSGTVTGVQQNHFQHLADIGADIIWYTADDVPKWVWQPVLADRLPALAAGQLSELSAYISPDLTLFDYTHATVGSFRYGQSADLDFVPHVWALKAGETQRFELPTVNVVLFDPFATPKFGDPSFLVPITSGLAFTYSVPATGVGTYNAATNVLTVVGPTSVGTYPTTPGGKPLESRPIYNFGRP